MRFFFLAQYVPLLAELPDPKSPESVGWVIGVIAGLVITAYYALMIWKMLFPAKVPPDSEVYATRTEMAKLEQDVEEEMNRIEERFDKWLTQQDEHHREEMAMWRSWQKSLTEWQLQIERAMGHVEVKAEGKKA